MLWLPAQAHADQEAAHQLMFIVRIQGMVLPGANIDLIALLQHQPRFLRQLPLQFHHQPQLHISRRHARLSITAAVVMFITEMSLVQTNLYNHARTVVQEAHV